MSGWFASTRDGIVFLAITLAVYVALIVAAKLLYRARGVRFRWVYHGFAAATGMLAATYYGLREFEGRGELLKHLLAATLLLASFPFATLLNHFLWVRSNSGQSGGRAPRLLSDTTTLVLCVAMLLLVLQFIYQQPVPGLLAGSGVAAIILGLAMQDLLANTIAGIALFAEKPFKTGDWLLIDGHEARVVEVTWRSVRLLTDDDVFLDVPNRKVVEQSIVNFHQPDSKHSVKTTIGLHYDVPPLRAQALLREAARCVPNVCAEPLPSVWLKDLGDNAVIYEIEVWIDDHGKFKQVLSDVRTNCWYAARRTGIDIPYPQLTVHRARPVDDSAATRASAADALRAHPIFAALGGDVIGQLVQVSRVKLFATTEHIIEQGTAGDSMFLLVRGAAEVRIARDGRSSVVAQLGAGDVFGEMSLLTGDARGATVTALTEVEVIEIRQDAFATHVRAQPDVLNRLSELLARRQLANEKQLGQQELAARIEETRGGLLKRFRRFFQLAD